MTYVVNGNIVQLIYFREILIASLGLLLVPKNIEINISDLIGRTKLLPEASGRLLEKKEEAILKLNSVSDAIKEVSDTYKEVAATTIEETLEDNLIDEILVNMEAAPSNILYEDITTIENGILEDLIKCMLEKNTLYMQDVIDTLEKHNSYIVGIEKPIIQNDIKQLVKIINQTFKLNKLNSVWKQKMEESKKAMSTQLEGVSKVINEVAKDFNNKEESKTFEKEKEEIEILLLQKNIKLYDLKIHNKNKRLYISIYTEQTEEITQEAKKIQKIEEILTKVLQEQIQLQSQKKDDTGKIVQTYISADKYYVTVGQSKIAKDRISINGDTVLEQKLEDGKVLLAISDGIGTGQKAQKYSGLAINLMQKLLGAGFEKEESLGLINSTILNIASKEEYATIDMCILDLFNGNAELVKNGACPTFIKNGKKVEKIEASCLPAGVNSKLDTVAFDKDLQPGDIIVMITDGILDANKEAIDKINSLQKFIEQINIQNPQKIADIILQEAIDYDYGMPKDDMSVIVAKIDKK